MTSTDHRPRGLRGRIAARPPWQRALLLVVLIATVVALLAAVVAGVAYARIYSAASIPAADELELAEPTVMIDQHGEQVATLEPAELRRNVDIDELPDHVPAAVLAAEDRRFYDHGGFSARDILRAAVTNITAGGIEQGASTIHQQYVAMALADIGDGYVDKFREAATADRLDDEVDHDTVLEMYLNSVPFGRTAQGIEAAARTYFDVPATELDVEQAALLAGMIAAPTAFDPERNPEGAANRRDFALEGMVEIEAIDRGEADELVGSELPELRDRPLVDFGEDAFFLETVRNQVPDLVGDDIADPSLGLVVHTTLDPQAQQLATEQLRSHLDGYPYQGALATLESRTGAVAALVGGLDYEESQYNVAFSGDRQPGSAFKTFTLAELVNQGYDPDTTRIEAPEEYDIEVEGGEDTTVGNYTNRGYGEVSAREATQDSINTPFVQLIEELGPDRVAQLATHMGVESELHEYPSLTLGTAEVMPLELTVAYATLAAEGTRHSPYMVERVEHQDGEVVYEHEGESEEVLDPVVAHVVTDVLVDVVEQGTGVAANLPRPNAGKTGTTDDYADAWFVGYTPQRTTGVWVGHLDNSPMEDRISGGSLPAQIWGSFMTEYVEGDEVEDFPAPDTSELTSLDELERPEPDPEPEPEPEPETSAEPDPEAREEDEDEDEDEDDEDDDEDEDEDEADDDEDEDEDDDEDEEPDEDDEHDDEEESPEVPDEDDGEDDAGDEDDTTEDDGEDDADAEGASDEDDTTEDDTGGEEDTGGDDDPDAEGASDEDDTTEDDTGGEDDEA